MKRALAFSGGKDSWACLWLEQNLDDVYVIWVNTGKNYPELIESIQKAKILCKNFIEVRVNRDLQNQIFGIPSDIVPINWTNAGQMFTKEKGSKIQSYLQCCFQNISEPLMMKVKELGVTHLVKGQRNDESHKSVSIDGMVVEGITFVQPIENWTKEEVLLFLESKMEIPANFSLNHSSMDCYDCTAYRGENADRIEFTKNFHPVLFKEFSKRDKKLKDVLRESLEELYG